MPALITTIIALLSLSHPELDARIARVTEQISAHPLDAELYVERGELHHRHADWDAAIADYERARQLEPDFARLDLLRAATFQEAGWNHTALTIVDGYIERNQEDPSGHLIAARAFARLDQIDRGDESFERAIELIDDPKPDLFAEWALLLARSAHTSDAIAVLDRGINLHGPVVTLQSYAIDLEVDQEAWDRALARIDTLMTAGRRSDALLLRKAEVLEAAGRPGEAREAYQGTLDAIARLPERHATTPSTRQRARTAQDALRRLGSVTK